MIKDVMVWLDGGVSDEIRLAAVADITAVEYSPSCTARAPATPAAATTAGLTASSTAAMHPGASSTYFRAFLKTT